MEPKHEPTKGELDVGSGSGCLFRSGGT